VRRALVALAALVCAPRAAHAFCGFYVAGSGQDMFNNATEVTLMRMGTRTVLSMQNNYQGPPTDFALVIPVPVVLQKEQVKTLAPDVFTKVDVMGSPRLVEYWEQDPCQVEPPEEDMVYPAPTAGAMMKAEESAPADYGVKIEAKFAVGEYQILILSATESTGLDRWLRAEHYAIPSGAAALRRPYVEGGWKFFVAKVDPKKVAFKDGMATLSPLRFYYDADDFTLPIRLGLANARSDGKQDLIINILSPDKRFQVANYKNVTIPTNLDVKDAVRTRFGEFYAALFDRTVEKNPGAVVTEYAWDASSCDPCPGPTLDYGDFMTLGADVLAGGKGEAQPYSGGFVLTRLHARYGKGDVPDDLVFKEAPPIIGGREQPGPNGKLEEGPQPSDMNNFQARYVIRHRWTGAIACANPVRGRWGGPPGDQQIAGGASPSQPIAATGTAFAPRGQIQLPQVVAQPIPELGVQPGVPLPPPAHAGAGCGCSSQGGAGSAAGAAFVLMVLARRRKR
jgi:uncharacterized protein (TIGR03382 family)